MSHWARLDENSIVVNVAVGDNTMANEGEQFFNEVVGGRWVKTSYNTRGGVYYDPQTGEPSEDQSKALRYNYAGISYTYDEGRDAFISPKPYESWSLDEETCLWEPPVPYPSEGMHTWDGESGSWVEVE